MKKNTGKYTYEADMRYKYTYWGTFFETAEDDDENEDELIWEWLDAAHGATPSL
jgi:hypothetical protein